MVVLDTDVVVGFLRGNKQAVTKIKACEEPLNITIITVFELLNGVYRSNNPQKKREEVLKIIQTCNVINLDFISVDLAALLEANQYNKGQLIGTFDTLIASMCLRTKHTLITRNNKHFKQIPGLKVDLW